MLADVQKELNKTLSEMSDHTAEVLPKETYSKEEVIICTNFFSLATSGITNTTFLFKNRDLWNIRAKQ